MGFGILNKTKNAFVGGNRAEQFGALSWDNYSPTTFLTADLIPADKVVTANSEALVGEYVIEPQSEAGFGFGSATLPYNQGTIYMDLFDSADTPASMDGVVRLVVSDWRGENTREVFRGNLSTLKQGASDITKRIKFPFTNKTGKQNDRLRVYFTGSNVGNGTVSTANSKVEVAGSIKSDR